MTRHLALGALLSALGCAPDFGGEVSDGGGGASSIDVLVPGSLTWTTESHGASVSGGTAPITVTLRQREGLGLFLPGFTPPNAVDFSTFWVAAQWVAERDDAGTLLLRSPATLLRVHECLITYDGGTGAGSYLPPDLSFRITGVASAACEDLITVSFEATFRGAVDAGP